jgi:hypothetical protein
MRGEKYLEGRIDQIGSRPNPALTSKVMLRVVLIVGLVLGLVFIGTAVSGYIIDHPGEYYENTYKDAQMELITIIYNNNDGRCSKQYYDWIRSNKEKMTWRQLMRIRIKLWDLPIPPRP